MGKSKFELLAMALGTDVTKDDVKEMILDQVDRIKTVDGIDLEKEPIAIELDLAAINRLQDATVLGDNPDKIIAFFAVQGENLHGNPISPRNTIILMPMKDDKFMKKANTDDYLAIERWDPAIALGTVKQIDDDNSILDTHFP